MSPPNPRYTTANVRKSFLSFFESKSHKIVASDALVPAHDPTLLFTNSGMVQFKNVFLGAEKSPSARVANVQRCLRAGGKHNDLDVVGYTARHHTFFEMLGNWSFGEYFKKEAITWAWELLTEHWEIPKERLWVTVYHTDDEAYAHWRDDIGIVPEKIIRIGDNKGALFASDNFWQMADTGPCGPCTEIFYDHGDMVPGGPPGSPQEDGDRFIEIWNLVFMQYDRQIDGAMHPLPAPCVDTGMGLERICAVLQHVHSNYEIDLFQDLIAEAAKVTATTDLQNKSLRVIADHIRASAFLIADGILPSNEGRGYVLRRIIRRALRHGWMLGVRKPFFHSMVPRLTELMSDAYPVLRQSVKKVEESLKDEEERFAETLDAGMRLFNQLLPLPSGIVSGADAFRLYDTYGFPLDLTADIAREHGLEVDFAEFEQAMSKQRAMARRAGKFSQAQVLPAALIATLEPTQFVGYTDFTATDLCVKALVHGGQAQQSVCQGEHAWLILDKTPFYAESGGQIGDSGQLIGTNGIFEVQDTCKIAGHFFAHIGEVISGEIQLGQKLHAHVAGIARMSTTCNHSATHLLHAALRALLGNHVEQKGSLVTAERLRFDFSHAQAVQPDILAEVEKLVNAHIRANYPVDVRTMSREQAFSQGAMALFGEKYGEYVRVVQMGEVSIELCGGTHVARTGDIGFFKIISENGIASGVRRIEAMTGEAANLYVLAQEQTLRQAAALLNCGIHSTDFVEKLHVQLNQQKSLQRQIEALQAQHAHNAIVQIKDSAINVQGIQVISARLENLNAKQLRAAADQLKNWLSDAVIVLAGVSENKVALIVSVSSRITDTIHAGELLGYLCQSVGGKGGGRADLAQGAGNDCPELAGALNSVTDWVKQKQCAG